MIYFVDTGILLRAVDRKAAARPDIVEAFRILRARGDQATAKRDARRGG